MNCEAAHTAMDAQFAGEPQADELPAHLEQCPACRARYEALARVDLVLDRGGLSEQRLDAMQDRIFRKLGAASAPHAQPVAPPPERRMGWRTMLAAAAALVLVVAVAIPLWRTTHDDDGFAPRGSKAETWGVRAFCVSEGKVTAEAPPGGTLKCARGSTVQFTYTAPQPAHLAILLTESELRFFPTDAERARVDAGTDLALPLSTPVGEWLTGPQQVTARFTDAAGALLAESALTVTP